MVAKHWISYRNWYLNSNLSPCTYQLCNFEQSQNLRATNFQVCYMGMIIPHRIGIRIKMWLLKEVFNLYQQLKNTGYCHIAIEILNCVSEFQLGSRDLNSRPNFLLFFSCVFQQRSYLIYYVLMLVLLPKHGRFSALLYFLFSVSAYRKLLHAGIQ